MKILAAALAANTTVKIDGRVAVVKGAPTASRYGLVKITLSGGRKVMARQDEPISVL